MVATIQEQFGKEACSEKMVYLWGGLISFSKSDIGYLLRTVCPAAAGGGCWQHAEALGPLCYTGA